MSNTWVTRDNIEMLISDMTDSHLRNAIRHLERRIAEYSEGSKAGWRTYMMLRGEAAIDAAENAIDRIETGLDEMRDKLTQMQAELARREAHVG
jgi:hypothetical protein